MLREQLSLLKQLLAKFVVFSLEVGHAEDVANDGDLTVNCLKLI